MGTSGLVDGGSDAVRPAGGPRPAGGRTQPARDDDVPRAVQLSASLALLLTASAVLNNAIFPSLDSIYPDAREISTFCGAAAFFLIAAVSYWRPRLLRERAWAAASFACLACGMALLGLGVAWGSALLVGVGAPVGGAACAWFLVLAEVSCTTLSKRLRAAAIVAAASVSAVSAAVLGYVAVPLELAVPGYLLCYVLACVLAQPHAHELFERLRRRQAPAEVDLTNPYSFLPPSHPVYVAILLFEVACGCALAFRSEGGVPATATLACVPVLVLFVLVVPMRRGLDADKLFYASALLAFAGFLLMPGSVGATGVFGGDRSLHLANALLQAGSSCFSVLVLLLVTAVGARNLLATPTMAALTQGASWLGVGLGAALGHAANALASDDPSVLFEVCAVVTFVFVAYNFVVLRSFSFKETIAGILPVGELRTREEGAAAPDAGATDAAGVSGAGRGVGGGARADAAGAPAKAGAQGGKSAGRRRTPSEADGRTVLHGSASDFEECCLRVARSYGLTGRETDVFVLLAHGRTRSVVEERLVLSHNTIKTHVRNIYMKLDVHSQQELIDLVEDELV